MEADVSSIAESKESGDGALLELTAAAVASTSSDSMQIDHGQMLL